jgi:hypothetical protein
LQQLADFDAATTNGGASAIGAHAPAMSVLLPADRPEVIRGVLNRLRKQTIAHLLEIVVVTPLPSAFEQWRSTQNDFHSVSIIAVEDLSSLGEARARAVRAARAACVFLGETHSFASVPEWAERLAERHKEGWAVVVPGFRNANPGSLLSWTGFLLDYGGWMEDRPAGEIAYWPLNNACCDRSTLLRVADNLANALSFGDQLILAVKAAGGRVYLQSDAALSHVNIARWKPFLDERWVGGHLIAGHRSLDWSPFRRLAYACAFPAIAVVLFSRVCRPAWLTVRRLGLPVAILPAMFCAAAIQALGEFAGYAHFGNHVASERRMTEYELHKVSYA